ALLRLGTSAAAPRNARRGLGDALGRAVPYRRREGRQEGNARGRATHPWPPGHESAGCDPSPRLGHEYRLCLDRDRDADRIGEFRCGRSSTISVKASVSMARPPRCTISSAEWSTKLCISRSWWE